jgi:transposase InsO family protein
LRERFLILYHVSYFDVPRRRVQQTFGVARSTFYRWLRRIDGNGGSRRIAWNRTPAVLARFVWQVAAANAHWGRVRIANQLRLLGIFVASSTVRNILNRPKPPSAGGEEPVEPRRLSWRSIPAFYPNHLWSADVTRVSLWGLWPADVLVIIDHFSRKLVLVRPLVSLSSEAICAAFEEAFRAVGSPKHLVTDRGFDGRVIADFLKSYGVKQRFGAVGQHGSIAVTERVNRTLKEEWLRRVPLIRGRGHLAELCAGFSLWYNEWRPHMTLRGLRPGDVYGREQPEAVPKSAKVVPLNIERRRFAETRFTGFRLRDAA